MTEKKLIDDAPKGLTDEYVAEIEERVRPTICPTFGSRNGVMVERREGRISQVDFDALLNVIATQAAAIAEREWRPITPDIKDGRAVLLKVIDAIPGKPGDRLAGIQFVGRNALGKDEYDYGWNFAAPVGYGGIPDDWLEGYQPLPPIPTPTEGAV